VFNHKNMVCLPFSANIAVEQEVIAADITIALLIYTLRMYTNTARSVEAEQGNDFRRGRPSTKLSRI